MSKIEGKTLNIVNENIEGLKQLFPEVFVEDKIDFYTSKEMNFAFIIYLINYFIYIKNVEKESLINYTKIDEERLEAIISNWEMPLWTREEYNPVMDKIRILK